ncbi:hypothetical protein, partial [Plasmodium yoelii yoelii]
LFLFNNYIILFYKCRQCYIKY